MDRRPNVFILSVDSLPHLFFGSASKTLAEILDGTNFTNAVAPGSFTSSAMPAIATGMLTDRIPAWGLPEAGEPRPIAEELSAAGYDCSLWTDNYLFGAEYNYNRGFDAGDMGEPGVKKQLSNAIRESPLNPVFGIFERLYFGLVEPVLELAKEESSFYRHAEELNTEVLNWLNGRKSTAPVCCWVHYMDTHHPYQPPSTYIDNRSFHEQRSRSELGEFTRSAIKSNGEGYSTEEMADLATVFEACCEYTVDALVEFLTELREQGHYDPEVDLVVVTADHGEILDRSTHEMLGHVPPAFWEEIVHVPLIIGHPEWSAGTVAEQVSLLDVKQSILDGVGIRDSVPTPEELARESALFVSEWEEPTDGSITTYRGVRRNDGRKLFGAKRDGEDRLVATVVDDGTERTVIDTPVPVPDSMELPDWVDELRETVESHGDLVEPDSTPEERTVDVDEQHLRDLGYIE